MQPVYHIPGDFLEAHVARLSNILREQSWRGDLHALLFLSGLRVGFASYQAASAGGGSFTSFVPSHQLDVGLDSAANSCVKLLVRDARSWRTRDHIKQIYPDGAPNPNWLAISLVFDEVFEHANKAVSTWISCGDVVQNKLRLSCAMGVVAILSDRSIGFVLDLMRKPFHFDDDIASAIRAFTLPPDVAQPEVT